MTCYYCLASTIGHLGFLFVGLYKSSRCQALGCEKTTWACWIFASPLEYKSYPPHFSPYLGSIGCPFDPLFSRDPFEASRGFQSLFIC